MSYAFFLVKSWCHQQYICTAPPSCLECTLFGLNDQNRVKFTFTLEPLKKCSVESNVLYIANVVVK